MMEEFDYAAAVKELEEIASRAEDPSAGLADIDKYIKTSRELFAGCRAYLRTARDKAAGLDG